MWSEARTPAAKEGRPLMTDENQEAILRELTNSYWMEMETVINDITK